MILKESPFKIADFSLKKTIFLEKDVKIYYPLSGSFVMWSVKGKKDREVHNYMAQPPGLKPVNKKYGRSGEWEPSLPFFSVTRAPPLRSGPRHIMPDVTCNINAYKFYIA